MDGARYVSHNGVVEEAFGLVVAFDRDTDDFVRGAEVGMLHQRLRSEPLPIEATMHVSNAEMALRLAESAGCSVRAEPLGDAWLAVLFA